MEPTLSEPESNFLRLVAVIYGPAQSAVRCYFDSRFQPSLLNTQLNSVLKKRIEKLRVKKIITSPQWDLLYPANGDAKSASFDLPLMITLLRHFEIPQNQQPACGFDVLPPDQDQKPSDDLARVKYYRNNIAHSTADFTFSNEDFAVAWTHLYGAISRLGDSNLKYQCDTFKCTGLYMQNRSLYEEFVRNLKTMSYQGETSAISQNQLLEEFTQYKVETAKNETIIRQLIDNITIEQANTNREIRHNLNDLKERLDLKMENLSQQSLIPRSMRAKNIRDVTSWIKEQERYTCTTATSDVIDLIKRERIVTVTGNGGSGKTALIRHAALQLMREGYEVVPVINLKCIVDYIDEEKRHVFVLDDVCGVHAVDERKKSELNDFSDIIQDLLLHSNSRLLMTLRLSVYKEAQGRNIPLININVLNLKDHKYQLSHQQKKEMFKKYFGKCYTELNITDKYFGLHDSFPLLCRLSSSVHHYHKSRQISWKSLDDFFLAPVKFIESEIGTLHIESPLRYCSLLLCILFNGTLPKRVFFSNECKFLIEDCCESCGLNRGTSRETLLKSATDLIDVYLRELNDTLVFTHDVVMDIVSKYIGYISTDIILKHADGEFIRDRVRLQIPGSVKDEKETFTIILPNFYHDRFFKRLYRDLKMGQSGLVFSHCQIRIPEFQRYMVNYLDRKNDQELAYIFFRTIDDEPKCYNQILLKLFDITIALLGCKAACIDSQFFLSMIVENAFQWVIGGGLYSLLLYLEKRIGPIMLKEISRKVNAHRFITILGGNIDVYLWLRRVEKRNNCLLWRFCGKFIPNDNLKLDLQFAVLMGQKTILSSILNENFCRSYLTKDIKLSEILQIFAILSGISVIRMKFYWFLEKQKIRLVRVFSANKSKCSFRDTLSVVSQNLCEIFFTDDIHFNEVILKRIRTELLPLILTRCKYFEENLSKMESYYEYISDLQLSFLEVATCLGHDSVVGFLLDNGANPSNKGNQNTLPISIAAMHGRLAIVERLLLHGADINSVGPRGCTLLMLSASYGHIELVKYLLTKKVNINAQNSLPNTALLYASRKGHNDIVLCLLSNGADPNITGENGTTALIEAANNGHPQCVKYLLQMEASVNVRNNKNMTALMKAAANGHCEVVEILLDHSASTDVSTNNVESALVIATENRRLKIVSMLLNFQQKDNTPLNILAKENLHYFSQLPCKLMAETIENNDHEINKAFVKAAKLNRLGIFEILLENGANPNMKMNNSYSILSFTACYSSSYLVSVLLENGANVNSTNLTDFTPLMLASARGRSNIVKLLLRYGADVNASADENVICYLNLSLPIKEVNFRGYFETLDTKYTPLMFAVRYQRVEIVKILLKDKKININAQTSKGLTPLMIACYINNEEIVDILIQHGARVNMLTNGKSQLTALSIAQLNNNKIITESLIRQGATIHFSEDLRSGNMLGSTGPPVHLRNYHHKFQFVGAVFAIVAFVVLNVNFLKNLL